MSDELDLQIYVEAPFHGIPFPVLISERDVEIFRSNPWVITESTNGQRGKRKIKYLVLGGGKGSFHRRIMGSPKGKQVDHIDGDGLNNSRSNLRVVTLQQNRYNSGSHSRRAARSSQFKGVKWSKHRNKWFASIQQFGVSHYLGGFSNEIDAARAYDKAAKKLFGEYARLNNV